MNPEILKGSAQLLDSIAWPVVAVTALVKYRLELGNLVNRIRKGGGAEFDPLPSPKELQFEAVPPSPAAIADGRSAVATASSTLAVGASAQLVKSELRDSGFGLEVEGLLPGRTPTSLFWEKGVREVPQLQKLHDPELREEFLTRALGRVLATNLFTEIDGAIWASQVALLQFLAVHREGINVAEVKSRFYEPARTRFPQAYEGYSFDAYLSFLSRLLVLATDGEKARITDTGIEYLKWRIDTGRAPKAAG